MTLSAIVIARPSRHPSLALRWLRPGSAGSFILLIAPIVGLVVGAPTAPRVARLSS